MATRKKREKDLAALQLKVTLLDVSPPVWRRLVVPAAMTLGELHFVVNEAMGWTCSHLHEFAVGDRRFGDPSIDPDGSGEFEDERKISLASVATEGATLRYEYDFGDDWSHEIVVEKRLPLDPRVAYPVCTAGARACPPEDCGGPFGYADLLDALRDERHPQHDEVVTWLGGVFDPEGFDVNRTNEAIRGGGGEPDE